MRGEFLGLPHAVEVSQTRQVEIRLAGDPQDRTLAIRDAFFQAAGPGWLEPKSLADGVCRRWRVPMELRGTLSQANAEVPVLFGAEVAGGGWCRVMERRIEIGVDLVGGAFFLLTRYEELVNPSRDRHGRFPADASRGAREGFVDRPVVNEYLEILWSAIERLWPILQRRARRYQVRLTHDVDRPFCSSTSVGATFRSVLGDVVRRRDLRLASDRMGAAIALRRGRHTADLCNTFDLLMDVSERHAVRSAFYFLAGSTDARYDGDYGLADPRIRRLLRRIRDRGHEIGLHASYGSYRSPEIIAREFRALREAAGREGLHQDAWAGRQHYLRWEAPTTWQAWDDAGLARDCTLGFAERSGFRAGTCYEFPVFNLRTRQRLRLRERPLVAMDVSLLAPEYMGLSCRAARSELLRLGRTCRRYAGDFELLWHNSTLLRRADRRLYQDVVEDLCSPS
jgi:peptidoglycan/xylan/chitin deacetylase (PgdA/CDA1 family)